HPVTLYWGLLAHGYAHLRRGDLPRATRVLERTLDLCRTWQIIAAIPITAATLGAVYALAGRADEALPLVEGAVEQFRTSQISRPQWFIPLCAGMTYLAAGRMDEAAIHAQEALALKRRLKARAAEDYARCSAGHVASAGGAEHSPRHTRVWRGLRRR